MSNDVKILDQPVAPQVSTQPSALGGIHSKETEPIIVSEIRHAGPEAQHDIDQELENIGVKEIKDRPDLTFEHKQIGLEHSGATTPVQTVPTGLVQIPQTTDINNSGTWFNVLTEKVQKALKLLGA